MLLNPALFFWMLRSSFSCLLPFMHTYVSVNCVIGMSLTIHYLSSSYLYSDSEFSTEWWTWLTLTGVFMACTWGSKVNGILTVFAIGFAVLIDLWDILDVQKEGHTMVKFYPLCGYFYSHPFIARITSGSTSLRGPLDLS